MIYGHGTDNPDKFTVPPDCYIVAIGKIGAVMSNKQFKYSIKALCALHKQYPDILTNPVKYAVQLQHALRKIAHKPQTIVIYGPGDECPDFTYTLVHHPSDGHAGVKCINYPTLNVCDLIPTDRQTLEKMEKVLYPKVRAEITRYMKTQPGYVDTFPINWPEFDRIHLYICMQYVHSIYPTVIDVFQLIERAIYDIITIEDKDTLLSRDKQADKQEYIDANVDEIGMYSFDNDYVTEYLKQSDMREKIIKKLEKKLQIYQGLLCQMYSGVFYNFVCRVRYEIRYDNPSEDEIYNDKLFTGHYELRPNVTHVKNPEYSPKTRQVLLNRIEEAQKRRRIQKEYYNSDLYKENRKKQNAELVRNGILGPGILHKRISRRKQTVLKEIEKVEHEKASYLPTNRRRDGKIATRNRRIADLQKQLVQLDRNAQRIKDNYENFINSNNIRRWRAYGAPNGKYVKIKGKWVPNTKKTRKMKHISPK